ncbi:MAG: hypothetical protein F4Z53_04540 [Acidimicrobiales bacterium]|nr:hypothetical protein [Acidimicrobiales bacterium]MXX42300.1 hypothetical protein [Acidimicrobiales bacterium]MYB80372.1 hypothetical protein [Acidimicrobiales bacterium]MYH74712.1 hypothetical protein [Acidimicrobiales bacterium]MYI08782.1 hypothetical protein [Acidimicrobiales bacterium]
MTSNGDLELTDLWQAIEACYEAGWTDGLPVVPPTEPLVDAMVAGGIWDADDVLLREPARGLEVSARKAAANAVMAGCLPEYFPVVGAALAAIGDPAFELHAVSASTGGAAVLIAVSGPIRDEIGIHCKENLFGPGFRANATIGRAVRLVLRNCLAAIPGKLDKSTQGWAGKYAMCFGEDEATSPWEPYHVSLGYSPRQSTVTVMAAESGHNVLNHASPDPEGLLGTFADTMSALGSLSSGRSLVVFAPEHARKLGAAGWSRARVLEYLFSHATRTYADVKRGGKVEAAGNVTGFHPTQWMETDPQVQPGDEHISVPRGTCPGDIALMVGGGDAGGHSSFFPTWSRDRSVPLITQEILTP